MSGLTLTLLGSFWASLDDKPVQSFGVKKVQALLICLAAEPEAIRRDILLTLLWPGMPERSARHNLRQSLYHLRTIIPEVAPKDITAASTPVSLVTANRQTIQLNDAVDIGVDVIQFEKLIERTQAHDHLDLITCHICREDLEGAEAFYRGDFLEDFYLEDSSEFEDWAQVKREGYRRKALDSLEVLTRINIHQKDYPQAQAYAKRQLEIDNLRESAYRQSMEVLALSGRREEAVALYESCRRLLAEELGMSPARRTTEVYEKILAGDLSFETTLFQGVRGYELKDEIGEGAYGTIHRAVQPAVGREVAVKVVRRKYANDPEFIRRFEAEAQTIAQLEHPYIVPLYDYWRDPEGAYLVMRYLRGGSLLSALKDGAWDLEPTLKMLDQIALALSAAHGQGIIHRDIKPANILLDEAGNTYLSDFGIAKNLTGEMQLTAVGAVLGTPDYISPEQIKSESVGPQSDIYSLGAVLYETLTGERPYPDASLAELIHKHLTEPIPLVSESRPDLPALVDDVIQKATAKEPADCYIDVLEMVAALREAVGGADTVSEIVAPSKAPSVIEVYNPYKGLRAFQEADADDFFGREVLVDALVGRLAESKFLAVVGPSGSGKSSAVKAGLIPALRAGPIPNSDKWFAAEMVPGTHPLEELELALWPIAVDPPPSLVEPMERDVRGMLRTIRRIMPDEEGAEILLIIDQFEELFTLVEDGERREFFLESLIAAIRAPRSPLRVIITLRADFYDRPLQHPALGQLLKGHTEIILPLNHTELAWAVREPAGRVGVSLEEGLAETIVADVAEQPGALPLLQYAMTELFDQRLNGAMTQVAYKEIGGVLGALGSRADEIYNDFSPEEQETVRQLFLRLVTLGEGVEDTRRRILRSEPEAILGHQQLKNNNELFIINDPQSQVSTVIDAFGAARLLTFDHDPVTREPTVEVAHEALLREWSRLRGWLDKSRNDVRMQRMLAGAAAEWIEAGEDPGFLLRDARLDQFTGWAENSTVALTQTERNFLEASAAARVMRQTEEEERRLRELETARRLAETKTRSARRLRWLAAGLALILLLAIGAALLAVNQRNIAQDNFTTSERIRLASQAQIALDSGSGGDLPALLALRSLQLGYSPEADAALQNALRRGFTQQQYLGHSGEVRDAAFSPDGRTISTGSEDGTAVLWDAQSGEVLHRLEGHTASVNMARFSPDGQLVATSSFDNSIRFWDVNTGNEVNRLTGHQGGAVALAFTPDGKFIVSGDQELIRLWDIATGQMIRDFSGHTDGLLILDISPDGRYMASVSADGTARLWDLNTGEEIQQFLGHSGWIGDVDFSPDGSYLVTGGEDRSARLWDIETGLEIRRFLGHSDRLYDSSFSPDGRTVLTSSYDKTARLWDAESGREIRQFLGHTGAVGPTDFSPDGNYIVTGGEDRAARLWKVNAESEPVVLGSFTSGHTQNQNAISISPSGQLVLTGMASGEVRLWDAQSQDTIHEVHIEEATINANEFSTDSKRALISSSSGTARLWDIQNNKEIHQFAGHVGPVWDGEFLPDGNMVLTGGDDGTVRLWDADTGREIRGFSGHLGPVRSVTISADGRLALSGSEDATARLWDIASGDELQIFSGHQQDILDVAFSPDGKNILTASADDSARLWDAQTGQEIRQFQGHTDQVSRVAVSPDGRYILTGSADQTARLWQVDTGEEIRRFMGHSTPLLYVDFSADGRQVLTADSQLIFVWRTDLDDVVTFACDQLSRDFTAEERELYKVADDQPVCSQLGQQVAQAEPTWTPLAASIMTPAAVVLEPLAQSAPEIVEFEFNNETANIQMGVPMQDIYIEDGNSRLIRPQDLDAETLALPLFRSSEAIDADFLEEPFEAGPFPMGEPHGFTVADWIEASGRGTYTVQGDRALVEMSFANLVPNGVYTVWCVEIILPPNTNITDWPCGDPEGTDNIFVADEQGNGEIIIEMDAFPPNTEETFYDISIAYHSDGKTYGPRAGDFGKNVHVQLFYDFLPQ